MGFPRDFQVRLGVETIKPPFPWCFVFESCQGEEVLVSGTLLSVLSSADGILSLGFPFKKNVGEENYEAR